MKKNKKILITGSSGVIGTRLFETLLKKGYKVVGFDRKANKWHKHLDKLTVRGDLLNGKDIKKIPLGIDLIIHLAANARVYDLVVRPDLALENIISTYNILDFARRKNINKIIFSSSREVYGNRKEIVAEEGDADMRLCESAYSASKISGEVLIYSFHKCYGTEYIVLRFSNVYGMYDESKRFVPLLIEEIKNNRKVEIYGKDKILDFTYIDDCVSGILESVEKFNNAKNNVINVASGRGDKLIDVANIMKRDLRSKSKFVMKPNRTGEVVKYKANISKAKKLLGYKPVFSTKKGISLAIDWYLKNIK